MTQISIEDALERIGSSKQRDRRDGLQDLKHILSSNKRSQKLKDVRDRGYHRIFEVLFRLAQNEKSNYIRYTKGSRNQAASVLSEAASIFRLAVEVGVKDIRKTALRAAIDHIIDTLPESDGHFCEPLSTHYLRALVAILQYQPHPGHLPEDQWLQLMKFCQESLRTHVQTGEESDSFNLPVPSRSSRRNDRLSRASSPSSISGIVTPVQRSFAAGDTHRPAARNNHIINDLVTCLYYLLRVPHARIIEVAKSSLDVLNDFLDGTSPLSQPQGQEKAFACFNVLLNVALTENLELAKLALKRCVHHARRLWHAKAHDTLKDQILASLGLGAPLWRSLVSDDYEIEQTRNDLELLLDVLAAEYCKRNERDLLQQDDVEICDDWTQDQMHPFLLPALRVRPGTRRAEHSTIILLTISRLHHVLFFLGGDGEFEQRWASKSGASHPRKRQKTNGPLEDLFDEVTKYKGSEQVARLQILAFLAVGPTFSHETLREFLEFVTGVVSNESNAASAWAMIAVALLAYQFNVSSEGSLGETWLQIWKLATQKLANPATCRFASHLVSTLVEASLVNVKVISDSIDVMLSSIELNGPIGFSDFSVTMLTKIVEFKGHQSPSAASEVADRVRRWIFLRWQPSQAATSTADTPRAFIDAQPLLKIFSVLLGSDPAITQQHGLDELGAVAIACERVLKVRPLMRFLLLQPDDDTHQWRKSVRPAEQKAHLNISDTQFRRLQSNIADALLAEVQNCMSVISEGGHEVRNMTVDGVSALCSLAVASVWISLLPRARASNKLERLQREGVSLAKEVAKLTLGSSRKDAPLQGILWSIGPLAGLPVNASKDRNYVATQKAIRMTAAAFDIPFWRFVQSAQHDVSSGPDLMEIDDMDNSQPGPRSKVEDDERPVDWLAYSSSSNSKNAILSLRICLAACRNTLDENETQNQSTVSQDFVEFILDRPPSDVLCYRDFLRELLQSDLSLEREQVERLMAYLGDEILNCYEFERSEVAMGLCLDFLTHFAEIWTVSEDEVAGLASEFYEWFTNVAIENNIASPHVHQCLSKMLQRVIALRPDYAKDLKLPSARSTLLKILENGQVSVKFETGVEISHIFGFFVLKEHDAILDDVVRHLPMEIDWLEGTAVRIYILSNLASSWSTLIRKCLFALVEAPFLDEAVTDYADYCIRKLSKDLKLANSNELFRLFASQIIYSWLESRPLESLPYAIFEYSSLKELLKDVQPEVTAQVLMRGRVTEAHVLEEVLSETWPKLLEVSFGKTAAYAIARDAAVSPEADPEAAHGVSRLTKLLGKEQYRSLIAERFPEILATFFKLIDREDSVIKGFEKYDLHAAASNTYGEIRSSGRSDSALASSQQPSFKASCLADEIDYICSRSKYGTETMWTPALYIFVFRGLVNTLHDALGPLHSITIIQRIRILVSMAGPTVLTDYPLEMTLHALRPLLVKTYCAEDTMGIFRYLLSRGNPYLQTRPSFLNGVGIAILVALRRFINTPQESTTQESQHRATIAKAEEFHAWVGTYLEESRSISDTASAEGQGVLVNAARQVRSTGSAVVGHAESDLLKALLHDQMLKSDLIDDAYRDLVLNMLCADFELPRGSREDIIQLDQEATQYADAVWSSCKSVVESTSYPLWVARIMGRAYAASGHVSTDLIEEANIDFSPRQALGSSQYLTSESRFAVLKRLEKALLSDDSKSVGLAESTLQAIVNKLTTDESIIDSIEEVPQTLLPALSWKPFVMPTPSRIGATRLQDAFKSKQDGAPEEWSEAVCLSLINAAGEESFVQELSLVVSHVDGLASDLFPYIVHLALLEDFDGENGIDKALSEAIGAFFATFDKSQVPVAKIVLRALLYLRGQQMPRDANKAAQKHWVEVDFYLAAEVAVRCSMFKTALLFLEIRSSETTQGRSSRRSSKARDDFPSELLNVIFQNLDDRDSFYGLDKAPNLNAMMGQLEFENAGFKSLSFRGAAYDAEIQQHGRPLPGTEGSLLKVLNGLDLDGLSMSMFSSSGNPQPKVEEIMFTTARKLEQWDLASPLGVSSSSNELFRVFQDIHDAASYPDIRASLDRGFGNILKLVHAGSQSAVSMHSTLSALGTLTEIEDVLSAEDVGTLEQVWARMEKRQAWMLTERFDRTQDMLSCRKTLFSMLSKSPNLQHVVNVSPKAARTIETQALLAASLLFREHEAFQTCLGNATVLDSLVGSCKALGVLVDVAAQFEVSNVMWDQAEMVSSIQILRDVLANSDLKAQAIPIPKPVLLARLGHRISEARLEKPDEIISHYLGPAIKDLHGKAEESGAGQVYHEFAAFCDQQLQDSDNQEDLERIKKLRDMKEKEVVELEKMLKSGHERERRTLHQTLGKARQVLEMDNREYTRLKEGRQTLMQQSLENYLLCLQASDSYDRDALRFSAMWLEYSDNEAATVAVSKHIKKVPSRKFASLMNQWTSRLLDKGDYFQKLLMELVARICTDHPFQGIYHIFASSKSKGGRDQVAISRWQAANRVVGLLKTNAAVGPTWTALHNSAITYVKFAAEKSDDMKQGTKMSLRKSVYGQRLEHEAKVYKIPPPTMKVELRPDCDYSRVPIISRYQSEFSIASGVSMPKIVTAVASNGRKYKQLFKSGNDDLRQDAIMEQVFEQVSNLLKSQRETRLRNLGIRTYRVLPLTSREGVIEFVPNTVPLHDFLLPAHQKYFPGDLKSSACRKAISDVQSKPNEERTKVFRQVCERFHPVLRHFFMERFENPDEWYAKRLAYTRSTAAISILGHILGLGDRHGHNILLDENSGEVVHIDLGIAFEQGRVLPVPEVVPFRLTRDVVDGMGITKTEGVFRRCCEFTLDALRKESYSIMTLLDVLRYDPLYLWSMSPLRLKRLQDDQQPEIGDAIGQGGVGQEKKDEQGEADRALMVVSKKLSKTLSVTATVNELIQQATDERNLALLFCGWAAYA